MTTSTTELDAPHVIRMTDLDPGWHYAPHSTDAGFMRWMITYVGGPPGHLHDKPESGIVGKRCIQGIMGLPVGQRQFGLHRHTTTEIYFILKGRVESLEGEGQRQMAGPMDCIYIPVDSPHCVRTVGDEDVLLLFYHDDHEKYGESKYVADDDPSVMGPCPHPTIIKWDDLDANWDADKAKEAGHQRWSVSWVGGTDGKLNHNPGVAAENHAIAVGATTILTANAGVEETWSSVRYLLVTKGRMRVIGHEHLGDLEPYDTLVVPAGYAHAVRAVGLEPLQYIWLHENQDQPQTG